MFFGTDKTGTLTEGNITLVENIDLNNKVNDKVLQYGLLCNSTIVHGKKLIGNSIDNAIWKHSGEKYKDALKNYEKIDEIPFDYERKRMSVIVKTGKTNLMIMKELLKKF